jgi:enoyl-CoA hydratase/carnithine racemase
VLTADAGDGVRVVTLNRPHRLNAIVPALLEALIAALQEADRDPAIVAIVLTGAGRAVCPGDDLKEFGSQSGGCGSDPCLHRTSRTSLARWCWAVSR